MSAIMLTNKSILKVQDLRELETIHVIKDSEEYKELF